MTTTKRGHLDDAEAQAEDTDADVPVTTPEAVEGDTIVMTLKFGQEARLPFSAIRTFCTADS